MKKKLKLNKKESKKRFLIFFSLKQRNRSSPMDVEGVGECVSRENLKIEIKFVYKERFKLNEINEEKNDEIHDE
jgi:hypothetical protein